MLNLTDNDFIRLHNYMKQHYGIDLSKKKQLIISRLSPSLSQEGYTDFSGYVDDIISGKRSDLITPLINKLTTNYTYFVREKSHFDYLMQTVLPYLTKVHQRDRVLSIWSAGCSSGEEPYTISMYLKEFLGSQAASWDTRILATDISQQILSKAKSPSYDEASLKDVPDEWRRKYFRRQPNGSWTVSPEIAQNVIFRTFNLMDPIQFKRKFDLIFCRNVMIYFDQTTKDKLVQRFYDATVPGGYLYIGHSESLSKNTCPYQYIMPAIFRKTEAGGINRGR